MTDARPKLLDLFCGAGGAAMGYYRAGFDVVGVDIKSQLHYPFPFIQGDALNPPVDFSKFDAVHASPPCQAFTNARTFHNRTHPDLLTPMRKLLKQLKIPWVIENVPNAPMRSDIILCGSVFGNSRLKRHRLFEFNSIPPLKLIQPCNHSKTELCT